MMNGGPGRGRKKRKPKQKYMNIKMLRGGSMNVIITGTVLAVGLLVGLCVREEYRRPQDARPAR